LSGSAQNSGAAAVASSAASRVALPGRSKIHPELVKLSLQLVNVALEIRNHVRFLLHTRGTR
jgi:hypothetical protein